MPRLKSEEERVNSLVPQKALRAVKAAYKETLRSLEGDDYVLITQHGKLIRIDSELKRTPIGTVPRRVSLPRGLKYKVK